MLARPASWLAAWGPEPASAFAAGTACQCVGLAGNTALAVGPVPARPLAPPARRAATCAVARVFSPVVAKAAETRKASTQARHKRLRKKVRHGTSACVVSVQCVLAGAGSVVLRSAPNNMHACFHACLSPCMHVVASIPSESYTRPCKRMAVHREYKVVLAFGCRYHMGLERVVPHPWGACAAGLAGRALPWGGLHAGLAHAAHVAVMHASLHHSALPSYGNGLCGCPLPFRLRCAAERYGGAPPHGGLPVQRAHLRAGAAGRPTGRNAQLAT